MIKSHHSSLSCSSTVRVEAVSPRLYTKARTVSIFVSHAPACMEQESTLRTTQATRIPLHLPKTMGHTKCSFATFYLGTQLITRLTRHRFESRPSLTLKPVELKGSTLSLIGIAITRSPTQMRRVTLRTSSHIGSDTHKIIPHVSN